MFIKLLWLGVVCILLSGCENKQNQESSNLASLIVGGWRGGPMQMSTEDSTWIAPYATGEQVMVFVSTGSNSGYYCKMGVSKDRRNPYTGAMKDPQKWDKVPRIDWLEAKSYLYDTFTANCGTYTISGDTMRRHFEFARNQAIVGASPVWEFEIAGDSMKTIAKDPWWVDTTKTVTTTIVWSRLR